jgi:predicted nucleic acid-binding protein
VAVSVIVDSSVVVALLTDDTKVGEWATETLDGRRLCAPHLMLPEAAHVLRRQVQIGALSTDAATLAHHDLVRLPVNLWEYRPLADRVWGLREAVTAYDATFVALAEYLDAPLATLDQRLARSHAPRCAFLTPDS